jgi:RHS repeat-associated protein
MLEDAIGSVRDVVADSGTLLNHYVYDSFGSVLEESNPGFQNDLLFGGRDFDRVTGLGYFRARYYEPSIGRLVRRDPIAPFGYEYGGNNPLLFSDPTGLTVLLSTSQMSCITASAFIWGYGGVWLKIGTFITFWTTAAGAANTGGAIGLSPQALKLVDQFNYIGFLLMAVGAEWKVLAVALGGACLAAGGL